MELKVSLKGVLHTVIFDDSDSKFVLSKKWFIKRSRHTYYVFRNVKCADGKWRLVSMHSDFLGVVTGGLVIDHQNGNGLDNRRANIRVATKSQNQWNRKLNENNSSGIKGVSWNKASKKWHATIKHDGQKINLGFFEHKLDAGHAYNEKAKEVFGEFAQVSDLSNFKDIDTEIPYEEYFDDDEYI